MIQAPPGYTPIPHGHHGGMRKRVGNSWVYWYRGDETPRRAPKELDEYQANFNAFNAGKKKAVEAARAAKGKPLWKEDIYRAEAEFISSPEGDRLVHALAGGRYDLGLLADTRMRNLGGDVEVVDNTAQLAKLSEQASGFAHDGPLLRGRDGALYTSDDFGLPGVDLAYKERLAKAYKLLYERSTDPVDAPTLQAETDIREAIAMLTDGSRTTQVHYPDAAAGTGEHAVGPGLTPAWDREQVQAAKRAQAVLTILATRRPPPVPLTMPHLYRGVSLPKAVVAGLHAGLTFTLNSGASASWEEYIGGVSPVSKDWATTYFVTYVFPAPKTGIDIVGINDPALVNEKEVVQAGTYAIERIDHVGGLGGGGAVKHGEGASLDSRPRLMVTLRALTPQELAGMKIKHSAAVPLVRASREIQVAIWAADVEAHAWDSVRRTEKGGNMLGKGGGWASKADAQLAKLNAEAEVSRRGGSVLSDPTSRLADPPIEKELRRTLAVFTNQGYNEGQLGRRVTLDMRGGRYQRALDTMRKAMEGKNPPRGFAPDGKNKGVWVKYSNGEAVQYWKAGKLFTPAEFEKHFMGEFDATEKVSQKGGLEGFDSLQKGDEAWLNAVSTEAARDVVSYQPGQADVLTDEQLARAGSDAIFASVIDSGGLAAERLKRVRSALGPSSIYDRVLKAVPDMRSALFDAKVFRPFEDQEKDDHDCEMCGTPMSTSCPNCGAVPLLSLGDVFSVNGGGSGR